MWYKEFYSIWYKEFYTTWYKEFYSVFSQLVFLVDVMIALVVLTIEAFPAEVLLVHP